MLQKIERALLSLVLLFLPTQLGLHFWPEFTQIYSLRIDYLAPTIYFWDLLVLMLIFIFLIQQKRINKLALNIFLIFILSQSFSLLQIVWNGEINLGAGLVRLEQYLIAGFFGVYIASKDILKIRNLIFWPVGLALIFEVVLALAQFINGASIGFWILGEREFNIQTPAIAKFDFYGQEFLRPYATFSHPNVLAGFIMIILPMILTLNRLIQSSKSNILTSLVLIASGLTIFLTVSRTALFTFFIFGTFFLKRLGIIILILSAILLSPIIWERFFSIFSFDSLSILRREELARIAVELFKSNIFLGVGLNNFITVAADKLLIGPSRFLQPVHNIYLLALAETGIMGLIGLLILIGLPFSRMLKTVTVFNTKYLIFSSWMILLFLGLFDHYFLTLPQGIRALFFLWGISFAMLEYNRA